MGNYQIKVCGMKYIDNIQAVSLLQPDFIGFIFYPQTPRYFNLPSIPELHSSSKKVGVFVNPTLDNVINTFSQFKLDFVQLHGKESPDFCKQLKSNAIPLIKAFSINTQNDLQQTAFYENLCDYFLFDSFKGGSGTTFLWDLLSYYTGKTPFFLAGGISLENLDYALAIQHYAFCGLDLNSKWEIQPGYKDIQKLKIGFQKIKSYDKTR